MTCLEKRDATTRGAKFPHAAVSAIGEALMIGHTSAHLLLSKWRNTPSAGITDISQTELMQRIYTGHAHLILDVRTRREYEKGHIPGAINIPHDQLGSRLAEIGTDSHKEIVLYCGIGGRVVIAANILQSAGFSRLLHLDGDMKAWLSNGKLPVARLTA